MKRILHDTSGFTLIESAIVMLVFGLLIGFSVPSFRAYQQSLLLEAARQSVMGRLRLGQQKAIGVGHPQRITFSTDSNTCTILDLVTGETLGPYGLPQGVTLEGAGFAEGGETTPTLTALIDGHFSGSGNLVLGDPKGRRDTILVLVSGQALSQ